MSGENSEPKYANFLCFVVSVQTNKLISRRGGIGYSKLQMETYNLIKSLYANGMGYRRISEWLNENRYKTIRGHKFKNTHVYSILLKKKISDKRIYNMSKPIITNLRIKLVHNH